MRPQDAGLRILAEQALDRVRVGVGVQHEPVLPGERHHAPRHRQVGIGAVQVELADRGVALAGEAILEKRDDRFVAHPGADVAAGAIRAQRRHHEIRRLGDEPLRAVVAGARDEGALDAGLAQDRDRVLRRQVVPRVVAVMHVRVEERELGGVQRRRRRRAGPGRG